MSLCFKIWIAAVRPGSTGLAWFGARTVLVALFALSFTRVATAALTPLASTSFSTQYNGDAYPPAAPFNSFFGAPATYPTPPSSDGNLLTYRADGAGGGLYIVGPDAGISQAVGWTMEVRYQIGTDGTDRVTGATEFYANHQVDLNIYSNKIVSYNDQIPLLTTIDSAANNDGAFHTLRMAMDPVSNMISIWQDGTLLSTQAKYTTTGDDIYFFGAGNGNVGGPTITLDYWRVDKTGAYSPVSVPEPATAVLLALGTLGVVLICRRHRRSILQGKPAA